MKEKRGQFYLIAILMIISLIIGVVTIKNEVFVSKDNSVYSVQKEISYEKDVVLNYIANSDLDDAGAESVLENFSKEHINYLGEGKNSFFIYGTSDSMKLVGNLEEGQNASYSFGGEATDLQEGLFEESFNPSAENVVLYLDNETYTFEVNPGQNIYYLIKYNYNNEVFIVHG